MNAKRSQKIVAAALSVVLLAASSQILYGYQAVTSSDPGPLNPTETTQQTPAELQALVAPIALYPDSLVAQILTASTFPDQVAIAAYWLEQQDKSLTGAALMASVNTQTWDPSVKALTQFPSVLDNLSKNLAWTSSLGEAFHNQQAEVMAAIQTLRAKAKAAGNLKTTPQVTVVQQSPDVIVIQPTNPQIVYVPTYNPTVIYGTPYVVPYAYSGWDVAAAGVIGFGAGIAVGAMMAGGCCSWGYSSWNCGWHGTAVVYHGGGYYGNTAWHGGYYNGGYHSSYGYNNNYNHYNNNSFNNSNYNRNNSNNNYNRNVSGNNVNVNKQSASNFGSDHSGDSWSNHSSWGGSNAFSGMSGHSGSGGFGGGGGWSSRAESSRGWGSMGSSGFGGGRFGGGGFGGGGFRR
ncbi:MAG TPA: DUF3300 domain-containing protein [Candidatus Acidoferrum sp.]|nr:DUF3300 domain-containing protein [Candidatus Acidoferrum sp.]